MRVTTALNRMLGLPGAWVRDVAFGQEAVIVTVVLRARKPVCSGCGARGLKIKEHREKRWRALDLGGLRCVIECRLRRLYCPGCGDVYEGGAVGQGGLALHARPRRSHRVAGTADEPDAGRAAAADRVAHGRHDPRAGRRRQARPPPPGRASVHRRGRGLIRRRAQVPDLRRRPSGRLDRVGDRGPRRRQLADVLRWAHGRAEGVDQGGLDRHVRRL